MAAIEPLILSQAGQPLIHAHANGYPPLAYRGFLTPFLSSYQVNAIFMRPFWPGTDPADFASWRVLQDDYLQEASRILANQAHSGRDRVVGMGHSLGAAATLMAAIERPELFRALVVIEPTLFPTWRGAVVRTLAPFRVLRYIHPLIRHTLRRKTTFPDRETMFRNYRAKGIFRRIPDTVLWDYVDGLGEKRPDDSLVLRYPPAWEARIYETGGTADRYILKNLGRISCPVLVIRGEESDTIGPGVVERLVNGLSDARGLNVPGVGHLLPLEEPGEIARLVLDFLEQVLD